MANWEDVRLEPILGWRHLVGSQTAAFARLPLGQFTTLSPQTTSTKDTQVLAAHLLGFPILPLEEWRVASTPQTDGFTSWLPELSTPPHIPSSNPSPLQRSQSGETVAQGSIEAIAPNAAPQRLSDNPLTITHRQPLRSSEALGNKVAEMTMHLLTDCPQTHSQRSRSTAIRSSNSSPLQAKQTLPRSNPRRSLFDAQTQAANPPSTSLESLSNDQGKETNSRSNEDIENQAFREPNTLLPESTDLAIAPDHPSFPSTPSESQPPNDLSHYDIESWNTENHPPQTDSSRIHSAPITPNDFNEGESSIPTGDVDISGSDDTTDTPPQILHSETFGIVPERSDDETDTARPPSSHSLSQTPVPTEETLESFQSKVAPEDLSPAQRQALPPTDSPLSDANLFDGSEQIYEPLPNMEARVEPTQDNDGSTVELPLQKRAQGTTDEELPNEPEATKEPAQQIPTIIEPTQSTILPGSELQPREPESEPDSDGSRAIANAFEPTVQSSDTFSISNIPTLGSEADRVAHSATSLEPRSRDRIFAQLNPSAVEAPHGIKLSQSNQIPLFPSVQAYLNAQLSIQAQSLSPRPPLADPDAYQLQPVTKPTEPPLDSTTDRSRQNRLVPSTSVQVDTGQSTNSSHQTLPIQRATIQETVSPLSWEDPFGLEFGSSSNGLDNGLDDTAISSPDTQFTPLLNLAALLETEALPTTDVLESSDVGELSDTKELPDAEESDSELESIAQLPTEAITLTAQSSPTLEDEALLDYLAEWIYGELRSHLSYRQETYYGIKSSFSPWSPRHPGFSTQTAQSVSNFPTLPLHPKLLQLTTRVRQHVELRLQQTGAHTSSYRDRFLS